MTLPQDVIGLAIAKDRIGAFRLSAGRRERIATTRRPLARFAKTAGPGTRLRCPRLRAACQDRPRRCPSSCPHGPGARAGPDPARQRLAGQEARREGPVGRIRAGKTRAGHQPRPIADTGHRVVCSCLAGSSFRRRGPDRPPPRNPRPARRTDPTDHGACRAGATRLRLRSASRQSSRRATTQSTRPSANGSGTPGNAPGSPSPPARDSSSPSSTP